jgi:hypothetical protein
MQRNMNDAESFLAPEFAELTDLDTVPKAAAPEPILQGARCEFWSR